MRSNVTWTGYDSGTVVPLEMLEQEHFKTDVNRLVVADDVGLQGVQGALISQENSAERQDPDACAPASFAV